MSAILTEGDNAFYVTTSAMLIDEDKDVASTWAKKYIVNNPALKWIVANYVEADFANSNGQMWTLEDLRKKHPTVNYGPMNLDHQAKNIVGTWVGSEVLYPNERASDPQVNPFVQVVGAFWAAYFPDVLEVVERSFNSGELSISMECVSDTVTCSGPDSCGQTFTYDGPMSSSYCECIRSGAAYRQLNNPHFLGGALIMPGNKPGWKNAHVQEMSSVSDEELDRVYKAVAEANPIATPEQWESTMGAIIARSFSKTS